MSQQSHGSRLLSGDWPFTFHVPVKNLNKKSSIVSLYIKTKPMIYRVKKLLSPEGLDVHILILLLTHAVLDEVFSLSCLAGEHGLSHTVGGRALAPRRWPVHAVKS